MLLLFTCSYSNSGIQLKFAVRPRRYRLSEYFALGMSYRYSDVLINFLIRFSCLNPSYSTDFQFIINRLCLSA